MTAALSHAAHVAMIATEVQAESIRAARIHGRQDQMPLIYPQVRRGWKLFDAASAQGIVRGRVDSQCVTWFDILMEEVCEAATETHSHVRLREELVQVASVAVSMVRALDVQAGQVPEVDDGRREHTDDS